MLLMAATVQSVFRTIGYILLALVTLMIMILIHETGHYAVGKALKFKINEFSIGFGPAILKVKRKNGELFSIRCIPLGGFCAFAGEDKDAVEEGDFNSQAPWKRILVLLAGVTFNFVTAIIVMTIVFASYGYVLPEVTDVNAPVESSTVVNLQPGDVIYQINGKNVYTLAGFNISSLLEKDKDNEVEVTVIRGYTKSTSPSGFVITKGGEKVTIKTAYADFKSVAEDGTETIYKGLGIMTASCSYRIGFFRALGYSFVFFAQVVVFLFQTIGGLFTGLVSIKGAVGGPITTIGVLSSGIANGGFRGFLYLLGLMSANLAIMNILPLPALDGSRVVFTLIEWIFRKPVPRKVEAIIHTVGLVVLFGLTIVFDILNLGMLSSLF